MPERSRLFLREPRWVGAHPGISIEAPVASWLYESGSLTARLRSVCDSGFGVRVLRQSWDRPFPGEARALGLNPCRRALVREVMLHCHDHPLVLARSVIPETALRGVQRRMAHLGERPLGELLFAYRKLARLRLDIAEVPATSWRKSALSLAQTSNPAIWGRRSLYGVARGQVLVCEFFLPALIELEDAAS